jgi:hypothetical protein
MLFDSWKEKNRHVGLASQVWNIYLGPNTPSFFVDIFLFFFILIFDKKIFLNQFSKIIFKWLFNYIIVFKKIRVFYDNIIIYFMNNYVLA